MESDELANILTSVKQTINGANQRLRGIGEKRYKDKHSRINNWLGKRKCLKVYQRNSFLWFYFLCDNSLQIQPLQIQMAPKCQMNGLKLEDKK